MQKKSKLKTILKISFIPYILLILTIICHSIFGRHSIDVMTTSKSVVYGIEAIEQDIFISIVVLWPVFVICIIYQIGYLINYIIKKYKERKGENEK